MLKTQRFYAQIAQKINISALIPPAVPLVNALSAHSLSLETLMAANLHLGHSTSQLHQRMLSYVYGERQDIHIINLDATLVHLRRACSVVRQTSRQGGHIVFLGTKPMLHKITIDAAEMAKQFYIIHWIGYDFFNTVEPSQTEIES